MSAPKRWLSERGASVLAALLLVAILGAAFLLLQYARASGSFAYNSASLTAATAAASPYGSVTPASTLPTGCKAVQSNGITVGYSCDCAQNAQSKQVQVTAAGDSTELKDCLDGCVYNVTPASPSAKITSSGTTANIQTGQCHAQVCNPTTGACTAANTVPSNVSVSSLLQSVAADPNNAAGLTAAQISQVGGSPTGINDYGMPTGTTGSSCQLSAGGIGQTDASGNCVSSASGGAGATDSGQGTYNAPQGMSCNNGQGTYDANGTCIPNGAGGNTGASLAGQACTVAGASGVYGADGTTCLPNGNPAPTGQSATGQSCTTSAGVQGAYDLNGVCQSNTGPSGGTTNPPNCATVTNGTCTACSAGYTLIGGGCSQNQGNPNTFQTSCPAGETGTPGNCISITPGLGAGNNSNNPLSNILKALTGGGGSGSSSGGSCQANSNVLTSFVTGLAQGISGTNTRQGYACSGNTMYYNSYSSLSCSYQQQPIQYCQYGCNGNACATSAQTSAPYGTGTNGAACSQPPSQPSASSCSAGYWQPTTTNGCTTGYQCVSSNAGGTSTSNTNPPTPSLSCSPQIADVGTVFSISYSCGNATNSAGSGFQTGGQLSGSTSTIVAAPPANQNTATYGLTCYNGSVTASAQCSLQINQPSIVLIANPSNVASGAPTAIGWVTSGMRSCIASSPTDTAFNAANGSNTSVNGAATTSAITQKTQYVLTCTTLGSRTTQATTTVNIGGTASATSTPPVSVSSTADSGTIAHGGSITITWSSSNPPTGSAMSLWLVNEQTGQANSVIDGSLSPNGTYTWSVPAIGASCDQNAANVCAGDLVNGDQYAIEAVLYTPNNAYVGNGDPSSNPVQPTYGASAATKPFTVKD